jgi:predicted helicase
VVWQVLQALRSHDDRFDAMVNKLDLIGKDPARWRSSPSPTRSQKRRRRTGQRRTRPASRARAAHHRQSARSASPPEQQRPLQFEIGEIERAIYAKLVQKVGNRHHWEDWAKDIAKIARTHIDRIRASWRTRKNTKEREAFKPSPSELRDDLNDSITDGRDHRDAGPAPHHQARVRRAVRGLQLRQPEPDVPAMQGVLDVLHEHHLDKEADTLESSTPA